MGQRVLLSCSRTLGMPNSSEKHKRVRRKRQPKKRYVCTYRVWSRRVTAKTKGNYKLRFTGCWFTNKITKTKNRSLGPANNEFPSNFAIRRTDSYPIIGMSCAFGQIVSYGRGNGSLGILSL